jgi:hypothetical protein
MLRQSDAVAPRDPRQGQDHWHLGHVDQLTGAIETAAMSVLPPVQLHFEDSGHWYSLPAWAEYFISVGKHLASADQSDSRVVTAIAVPTRAFGAAFVSLGMVISDAAVRDHASESAHFEKLFDLPAGTPVVYRPAPGKTFRGILQAPGEHDGKLEVRVQVHSKEGGARTYPIDQSRALQVQPAGHSGKLPKTQGGKNARFANQFVDSLLGDADPVQLGLRSKVVCTIVGKRNALEHEIRQTPLALHANGHRRAEGQLQDVLRVNRFVTGQQSHRSALVPLGTAGPPEDVIAETEMGVVFDGALGFLKWGQLWRGRHQVIILDRTEPYFDDAISAINTRFSQNRVDGEAVLPGSDVPAGGEVLAFREAVE